MIIIIISSSGIFANAIESLSYYAIIIRLRTQNILREMDTPSLEDSLS